MPRTYFLLRVHDGKVSEIASSKDLVLNTESSEFSTYLLAYSDKKNGKKEDGKEDKEDKEKKKDKKKSAETGDESNALFYLILGGGALLCAGGAVWFGFRKKKR